MFPLRARDHLGTSSKGAPQNDPAPRSAEEARFRDVESTETIPLSIVAPRRIGESELVVYPLALGGSVFGWTSDAPTSVAVLDRFAALGGNFIDTADSYSGGRSELIIGGWMRAKRNRDSIVLATKIGRNQDNPGLGPVSMVRAVEASLERLGTDHIDLLGFHDDDPGVPLDESLATAEWLISSGKVRYLTFSNYSAERLIEARILSATGLPKVVAIQTHYNLMHRMEFEGDLRIVASAQSLAVLPYFALASGFLTGKYRTKVDLATTVRGARAGEYLGRRGNRVISALQRVAAEQRTSPATIALAWLLAKRNVVAPVASASRPEQVDALMAAAGIRLTRAQMLELDRASE